MPTVFLSYAHDDNRVPDGLKGSGWVSFFDNSLRIELDERGMVDVKVWRDKRDFNTMDVVTNTLDAGVTSSDVFLPVVSPLYLKKQYTIFELEGFVKHKSGAGSDARRNILMVLKRPVPEDQYPQAIRGMGYIPFFEIDREKGQDEPYFKGYASTAPSDKYWDAIREVAKNLQQFFAELADQEAAKRRQQEAAATSGATVYLAHPSNDLSDACWSFRKELEAQGCRVVPRRAVAEGCGGGRETPARRAGERAPLDPPARRDGGQRCERPDRPRQAAARTRGAARRRRPRLPPADLAARPAGERRRGADAADREPGKRRRIARAG